MTEDHASHRRDHWHRHSPGGPDELDWAAITARIGGGGGGDLAAHLADTVDAHDASAISFVPTGTIAATNVQAAITEAATEAGGGATLGWFNVQDYGAVGNGSTNDTTAINNAVTAAGTDSTVYFPTGTYMHDAGWTLSNAGVRLLGDQAAELKMRTSGTFITLGAARITIENLKINGNGTAFGPSAGATISASNSTASYFTIRNCHFVDNAGDHMILCAGSSSALSYFSIVDNLIVTGPTKGTAIQINEACEDFQCARNRIIVGSSGGSGYGSGFGGVSSATKNTKRGVLANNTIIHQGTNTGLGMGMEIIPNGSGYPLATGLVIANNTIVCTASCFGGFSLGAESSIVTGNTVTMTGTTWNYGMEIVQGCNHSTYSNNTVDGNGQGVLIVVNGASDNVVTGNNLLDPLSNNGYACITILGTDGSSNRNVIVGNHLQLSGSSLGNGVDLLSSATFGCDNNLIANNVIYGGANRGVHLETGGATIDGTVIAGNKVVTAEYGFSLQGSTNTTIRDNVTSGINSDNVFSSGTNTGVILQGNSWQFATVAPTTKLHFRGEVCWNTTPSAAGPPGWVCTTAGTPGTWKAMANVAA